MRKLRFSEASMRQVIARLPPAKKAALRKALDRLRTQGPDGGGLDIRQLHGPGQLVFRLRVGDLRVAFRLVGKDIEVVRIFPRRDGYGWMERLA